MVSHGHAWKIPDASLLSDTFSVSEEDAKKFLVEWREFLECGKDRVLPDLWIANLARDYGFNSDWLINGTCAIGRKRVVQSPAPLSSQKIDTSIIRELEKKIMKLEDEKAVQDKRINGLEYTIELQKRLLDPQEKGPQALTTSGDVVPPVPTSPSAQ